MSTHRMQQSAGKRWLGAFAAIAMAVGAVFGLSTMAQAATNTITVCSSESECDYTLIQDAIDAASDGDTVTVAAGNYSGELVITKAGLTLQGAQAGVDARSRSGAESVITAGRIQLSASNITVEGFTLTGAKHGADSSAAIWGTEIEGTQILDNIIKDSFMGVQFDNSGGSTMAVVRHNVFSDNNVGTNSGSGVFMLGPSSESTNISIVDNTFSGHVNAAINVNGHNATISGNTSSGDSTFAVIANSSDITITDNVATGDPDGSGIFLGRGNDGVTISGNTLNSVATAQADTSAVRVAAYAGEPTLSQNYTIHNNIVTGSWSHAIRVTDGAYSGTIDAQNNAFSSGITTLGSDVSVDATSNWWGSADPDFGTVVSGDNVSYDPWFTSSAMNVLSNRKTVPDSSGDATVNNSAPQVVVTSPTQPIVVTVTAGTVDAGVDYSSLVTGGTGSTPQTATIPQTTVRTSSGSTIQIPASTTVTATGGSWDGVITAPTVVPNSSVTIPVRSGSTAKIAAVIEVGASGVNLTFDKAVRLLIPGQAGKLAGFVRDGVFTQITDVCAADTQVAGDALATSGDCSISVGADLVVWTKHFTTFVAYSSVAALANTGAAQTLPLTLGAMLLLGVGVVLVARRRRMVGAHRR